MESRYKIHVIPNRFIPYFFGRGRGRGRWVLRPIKCRNLIHFSRFGCLRLSFTRAQRGCRRSKLVIRRMCVAKPTSSRDTLLVFYISFQFKDMCIEKEMKQRPTKVLLGTLSMVWFCIGHTSIEIHQFWRDAY